MKSLTIGDAPNMPKERILLIIVIVIKGGAINGLQ
jgi:hypothetical protein